MSGEEFEAIRRQIGLSGKDLSEKLSVHPTTVSRWENDHLDIPPMAALSLQFLLMQHIACKEKS